MPFRVSADASLHYLGEGMLDLLAAKPGGVVGPAAVDPRTVLNALRQAMSLQASSDFTDCLDRSFTPVRGHRWRGRHRQRLGRIPYNRKLLRIRGS
jgi:hypothetical protein